MTRTLRCVLLLAGLITARPAHAGPALSCSSDGTKGAVAQIITKIVLKDIPADRMQKFSVTTSLDVIRTDDASTDRRSICHAVLGAEATFTGPRAAETVPPTADELRSQMDALMQAADLPEDVRQAVRRTADYTGPRTDLSLDITYRLGEAMNDGTEELKRATLGAPTIVVCTGCAGLAWDPAAASMVQARMRAAQEAVKQTADYRAAERAQALKEKAWRDAQNARSATELAGRRAERLDGEIVYTVEATDDGRAYITLVELPQ